MFTSRVFGQWRRLQGTIWHARLLILVAFSGCLVTVVAVYTWITLIAHNHQHQVNDLAEHLNRSFALQFALVEREVASIAARIAVHGAPSPLQFSEIAETTEALASKSFLRAVAFAPIVGADEKSRIELYIDRHRESYAAAGYKDLKIFPKSEALRRSPLVLVEPPEARSVAGLDLMWDPKAFDWDNLSDDALSLSNPLILREDRDRDFLAQSFIVIAPVKFSQPTKDGWTMGLVAAPITPELMLSDLRQRDLTQDFILEIHLGLEDKTSFTIDGRGHDTESPGRFPQEWTAMVDRLALAGVPIALSVRQSIGFSAVELSGLVLAVILLLLLTVLTVAYIARVGSQRRLIEERLALREDELRHSERKLAQAQKQEALGQLVGGVAHDFNNVIAVMLGNAELLEEEELSQNGRKQVNAIITSAERGTALSRQLLAFGRQAHLKPVIESLDALLLEVQDLLSRVLPESITLQIDNAPDLPAVYVDRHQLMTAILNLALNARDAMHNGGSLSIGTTHATFGSNEESLQYIDLPAGRYTAITITDTGTGMTSDQQSRAFDPFFTTKPIGKGTGLGLSMVHGFARQSGGTVTVSSEIGVGTTVTLYLPVAAAKSIPTISQARMPVENINQAEILIVEDDAELRDVLRRLLESRDHYVIGANCGDTAMDLLERGLRPNLILTDVVMPGKLQGVDFALQARELIQDLPVIFLSGYLRDTQIEKQEDLRGCLLLQKPLKAAELFSAVGELIGVKHHVTPISEPEDSSLPSETSKNK